jgi:hypothetical protein
LGAGIWSIILTVIGLREVHGISLGKAIAAVVIPLAACCVLICGAFGFIIAAAMSGTH